MSPPQPGSIQTSMPVNPGPLFLFASACMLTAIVVTFYDLVTGGYMMGLLALVLVATYLLICWKSLKSNAIFLIGAGVLATGFILTRDHAGSVLGLSASRSMYIPSLIALMSFLRLSALDSPIVLEAGRYIVNQPPGRRYLMLALGGNIFGVLLNLGGLLLLLSIALQSRAKDDGTNADRLEIQGRRITNGVLRGFCASVMWSPLGAGMNMGVAILAGFTWVAFLPLALAGTAVFMFIGWVLDRREIRPRPGSVPAEKPKGALALVRLVAHLASIIIVALIVETVLGIAFRAAVIGVLPVYALCWNIGSRLMRRMPVETHRTVAQTGFYQLNRFSNEIGILFASGYVGLLLAAMLPPDLLPNILSQTALSPWTMAAIITAATAAVSMVGVNPMITASLVFAAFSQAGVSEMPNSVLVLAVLLGWTLSMLISPVTATLTIAASCIERPVSQVGLRWNGPLVLISIVVFTLACLFLFPYLNLQ